MEYETNDGWDLDKIDPLDEFINAYDEISKNVYELRNCIRTKTLVEMRDELLNNIENMKFAIERIDDNDKIIEVDE